MLKIDQQGFGRFSTFYMKELIYEHEVTLIKKTLKKFGTLNAKVTIT